MLGRYGTVRQCHSGIASGCDRFISRGKNNVLVSFMLFKYNLDLESCLEFLVCETKHIYSTTAFKTALRIHVFKAILLQSSKSFCQYPSGPALPP